MAVLRIQLNGTFRSTLNSANYAIEGESVAEVFAAYTGIREQFEAESLRLLSELNAEAGAIRAHREATHDHA